MKRELTLIGGKSLLVFLLIFLAVLAAAVLILRENIGSMIQAIFTANFYFVPLAVLVYLFGLVVWSMRWHVTLATVGYQVNIRSIYVVIFGGIFVNNVHPFTYLGGDPVARAYLLKKTQNVPYSCGFATILSEYVVDLPIYISLLMFGVLNSFKLPSILYDFFVFGVWIAFIVGWSFFFMRVLSSAIGTKRLAHFASRLARVFRRHVKEAKLERSIKGFYFNSARIIKTRKVVVYVVILTAAIWAIAITRLYIIFLALGYTPQIPMLLLALTLPALVGLIPSLPGGLGTVDFTIAGVFLAFGVPSQIAISAMLIERAITLGFSTLVGFGAISYLGIKQGNPKKPRARRPQ